MYIINTYICRSITKRYQWITRVNDCSMSGIISV